MAIQLARKKFYDSARPALFDGAFSAAQFTGMEGILSTWEKTYQPKMPITQLAYCLATAYHETARAMQPVNENGGEAYFTRMYDIKGARPHVAHMLGNTQPGDGALFHGRGLVQLTGRALYDRATGRLRQLGFLGPNESLIATPALALRDDIAIALMFEGMLGGWFTGRDLGEDIDPEIDGDEDADFIHARDIINGKDRAPLIAGYGMKFLTALRLAA